MKKTDLTQFALKYARGRRNRSDVYWLGRCKHIEMTYIDDRMTWSYVDGCDEPKKEDVALAFLWGDPRDISEVKLRCPATFADSVAVCVKYSHSPVEDTRRWKTDTEPYYLEKTSTSENGGFVEITYKNTIDWVCKLYVVCPECDVDNITVQAFGAAEWAESREICVLTKAAGNLTVFNGGLSGVTECLCDGLRVIHATLALTNAPQTSKTVLQLGSGFEGVSVYADDIISAPVFVPGVQTLFLTADMLGEIGETFKKFSAPVGKTTRRRVSELPEADLQTSVKVNFSDKPLRMFSVPPFEPEMKIDVPDPIIMGQYRNCLWHFLRNSFELPDGRLCVSIWPFDKGAPARRDGNEGAAAIAGESEKIITVLDLIGSHKKAEAAINYWLDGESALPYFKFAEVMGEDALANPYNSFNKCSPGYDQKHTAGHGQVLKLIANHYGLTHDDVWFDSHIKRITGACMAVVRLRAEMKKHLGEDSAVYGLLPPSSSGDFGETRIHYMINGVFCEGLERVGKILSDKNVPEAAEILADAADFRKCLLTAVGRSVGECPVIKALDGTYRRYLPWQPFTRGMGAVIPWCADPTYFQSVLNGLWLVPHFISADSPIVDETLDMLEDTLYRQENADISKSVHGNREAVQAADFHVESMETDDENTLYRGGYGLQCGIETHKRAYQLRGEAESFLRALYNSYAVEIDPDRAWIFWEGPHKGGAADKTFEEAAFVEYLKGMLVSEENGEIRLCRTIPKAWLCGERIAVQNAPVCGGKLSFELLPELEKAAVRGEIILAGESRRVTLRLRLPDGYSIASSTVGEVSGDCVSFDAGNGVKISFTVNLV